MLSLILFVCSTKIASAQITNQVAVTARVALSPQHIFGIQKNSQLIASLPRKHLEPGDTATFSIYLKGLHNVPQKNREVTTLLKADNNYNSIKLVQQTDENGLVTFSLPIEYQHQFHNYSVHFFTLIEGRQIDLFNSLYIEIIGTDFTLPKTRSFITYILQALPLEKIAKVAYSAPYIFVTLKGTEKLYGFVKKTIAKPAANFAAARDGPVVICGTCQCGN
jgi:hypothetical protein